MLRIRRFDDLCDLEKPMEIFSFKEYSCLEDNIKDSIIKAGKNYLNPGNLNKNTDIIADQSYSERQLFEKAYDRLKSEFEAVLKTTPEEVQKKMDKALGRNKNLLDN